MSEEKIDLHTKESRTALTKMVMRLFGLWQISIVDQAALLNRSLGTIRRYRNEGCFADNNEILDRVGSLLSIHSSLKTIFSHNDELVYKWIVAKNQAFEGQPPIEVMMKGLGGIITVRRYLESNLYVRAALGLHPQLVAERIDELPLWERYLPEARYVGEVGLDAGPRFYKSIEAQKHVFRIVLERCAEAGRKIISVHSVRSVPAVLDMIEKYLPRDRGVVVLHWFTGSKSEARRAAALGCYFSVNAEMVRSDRSRALVADLPMDRILTESDGPFTQIDGHPAEPSDMHVTNAVIARVRNVPSHEIATAVQINLKSLLR